MITSTTTMVPRKGTLKNIKGLSEYIRGNSGKAWEIRDILGKKSEIFSANEEYNYITEGMYINMKTYFLAISCRDKIILLETSTDSMSDWKIIDAHFVELNENNSKQIRLYNETKGKSGMHFT